MDYGRYPAVSLRIGRIVSRPHLCHLGCLFGLTVVYHGFQARRFSVDRSSDGHVAGWLSVTAGIVSKRLNLSENFLDHLVGPSLKHLGPLTPIPNSTGNPFIVGVTCTGVGKLAIFVRFST